VFFFFIYCIFAFLCLHVSAYMDMQLSFYGFLLYFIVDVSFDSSLFVQVLHSAIHDTILQSHGIEHGFPTWDTCTPGGTFAYPKGYI